MAVKNLFLFATDMEAAPLCTLRPEAAVAIIDVGMARAAANTAVHISTYKPQRVVLCGIAGACDERLQVGQVVEVVRDSIEGLPEAYAFDYGCAPVTGLQQVRTLTVSRSGDAMRNEDIITGDMPVVEQMESAGVAATLSTFDHDNFVHIRAISNRVGEPFEQWHVGEAVAALAAVVAQLFTD